MNKFGNAGNAWTSYLPAVRSSSSSSNHHPHSGSHQQTSAAFWDSIGKSYQIAFDSLPAQHGAIRWLIGKPSFLIVYNPLCSLAPSPTKPSNLLSQSTSLPPYPKCYTTTLLNTHSKTNTSLPRLDTLPPKSHILDLGCGTGHPVCTLLAAAGHFLTGIDISPEMIRIARAQCPTGEFLIADLLTFVPSTASRRFNAVISIHALIADVTRSSIYEFFTLAASLLVEEGGLLVYGTVPVPGESVRVRWLGQEMVCSGLSVAENVEGLEAAGFEILRTEVEKFTPRGAVEAGICAVEDVWEEEHLFVWARKRAKLEEP